MKQFKLFAILSLLTFLSSCSQPAIVEKTLLAEQIEVNLNSNCEDCLEKNYRYKVKLGSNSGEIYYYTNYKHEVGDTLVSSYEFFDAKENSIKQKNELIDSLINEITKLQKNELADSLINENVKLQKKISELSLYNQLLLEIIQNNAKQK